MVLNLLLIGLVISLEPIPLTAFILVLASKNGVQKGAAFIFGWLLSLALVIAFTLVVTDTPFETEHSTILGCTCSEDRHRCGARDHCNAAASQVESAEGAKEGPEVADRDRQHVDLVRHRPRSSGSALGACRGWRGHHHGGKTLVLGVINRPHLVLPGRDCNLSGDGNLRGFLAYEGPGHPYGLRSWLDNNTDQVIIVVSLVLGFWLIGNSIYLVVS